MELKASVGGPPPCRSSFLLLVAQTDGARWRQQTVANPLGRRMGREENGALVQRAKRPGPGEVENGPRKKEPRLPVQH